MEALGRHVLVELYDCDPVLLDDVAAIEQLMIEATDAAEATIIDASFHHFSPIGVSGVVVIQESHLAIHTWPESGYAAVDLFTCGPEINPWTIYDFLHAKLKAGHGSAMELLRGQSRLMRPARPIQPGPASGATPIPPPFTRRSWMTDRMDHLALSVRYEGARLLRRETPFQRIELYQTPAFGKLLVSDGRIVYGERDEYVYHEMAVHVPMQAHGGVKRVKVLGGGDGGLVRELLKYPEIEYISVLEIDAELLEICQAHFPQMVEGFSDKRVSVEFGDSLDWKPEEEGFDLILVDFEGAPISSAIPQWIKGLNPSGMVAVPGGMPRLAVETFQHIGKEMKAIFQGGTVAPFIMPISTLPGGMSSFWLGSRKGGELPQWISPPSQHALPAKATKHYNRAVHSAAFALPNDLIG
ncbi:adenosylmethionine decarboxylase [Pontibacter sp. G13]|uniref:adenosylmethionine decarboxylase n=1 Tax=Pontibacter sp. G13 TaxID=3074898 RepID=UPI0028896419|nr:adenosylmethionine decarboxylase [Pontibacter sp. G13]WNJ19571.1 adenosylmethionine decarboxylase [Pontibacter sp. G13]